MTGAAGTLGSYVIPLAVAEGVTVVADASDADSDLVRSFGASVVVRRGPDAPPEMAEAAGGGVDGLVDGAVVGGDVQVAVRSGGAVAAVRLFDGTPERGITVHQVVVRQYLRNQLALAKLAGLAAAGRLQLRVAGVLPFDGGGGRRTAPWRPAACGAGSSWCRGAGPRTLTRTPAAPTSSPASPPGSPEGARNPGPGRGWHSSRRRA